jgi:hypothetical protein
MVPVLFDGSTRHNADLAEFYRIIDFRPGQLLVSKFSGGTAHSFTMVKHACRQCNGVQRAQTPETGW